MVLTLDKHSDRGPQRLFGEGGVLGLAGDALGVVLGARSELEDGGHCLPVGKSPGVFTVLSATWRYKGDCHSVVTIPNGKAKSANSVRQ